LTDAAAIERLATEIAALSDASRDELVERWEKRFGNMPPKGCNRRLLELGAAYVLQEKIFGDDAPAVKRLLDRIGKPPKADDGGWTTGRVIKRMRPILRPGTRLVRDWNGRTYHVEVLDRGYAWNGRVHNSLSVIAREITGVHWSGPRFFGL